VDNIKRLGVLTGGGDAPGLNPAIRGVFYKAVELGYEVIGIKDGWKGLLEKETIVLSKADVDSALTKGGTILGSSRTNPYKEKVGKKLPMKTSKNLGSVVLLR